MNLNRIYFGLMVILLGLTLMSSDCDGGGNTIINGIGEALCPDTGSYVHTQEIKDAVFSVCSTTNPGTEELLELEMTIDGTTTTYESSNNIYEIRDLPRVGSISLKAIVTGYDICDIKIETLGAPLAGGEQYYISNCASSFANEQSVGSQNLNNYCRITLEDEVGEPFFTESNRYTTLNVFASLFDSSCNMYNREVNFQLYYED